MDTTRVSERGFVGVSAALFAASVVQTVVTCASMSAMGSMSMPGGWKMSMTWMRMPGQTWPGVAAAFVGMWCVMMAAMMMPSLMPMLARYRRAVRASGETRPGPRTVIVSAGYFLVWTALGVAVFPLGVAAATVAMEQPALARAVPIASAAVIVLAGWVQLTAWKTRQLACCRVEPMGHLLRGDVGTAWRHGLRLGLRCVRCCAGLTAVLLVIGVMDLRAMAAVAVATTIERVAAAGDRFARATGALLIGMGLFLLVRAMG
jgi:predicted metal-binding membrane protein